MLEEIPGVETLKKGWNLHIKVWASTACRQIVKLLGWLHEIHLP